MLEEDTKNFIINILDKIIFGLLVIMTLLLTNSYVGVRNSICAIFVLLFLKFLIKPSSVKIRYNTNIMLSLAIFYIVIFIVSFFSLNAQASFQKIFTHFILPTIPLFLFSNLIKNKKQFLTILVSLVISILSVDIVIIWKGLHGIERAMFSRNHPLVFGAMATLLLPLFLVGALDKTNLNKNLRSIFLTAFILTTVALIFNGSRGAWLASSLVLVLYILTNHHNNKKALGGIVFFGFLFLTLAISFPEIKSRIFTLTDMQFSSNSERILMWQGALKMIADYPVFGIGTDSFYEIYNNFYISPESTERQHHHAHNLYLQHFVETGIFGFMALIYLFYTILRTLWKNSQEYCQVSYLFIAVFLGKLSLMLVGLTDYLLDHQMVMRLYWALIGICLSVSFWQKQTCKMGVHNEDITYRT